MIDMDILKYISYSSGLTEFAKMLKGVVIMLSPSIRRYMYVMVSAIFMIMTFDTKPKEAVKADFFLQLDHNLNLCNVQLFFFWRFIFNHLNFLF